jgi:hypothetical protein
MAYVPGANTATAAAVAGTGTQNPSANGGQQQQQQQQQQRTTSARAASKAPLPPHAYPHNHSHHHPSPPSSNTSNQNPNNLPSHKTRPTSASASASTTTGKPNKIWSTSSTEERERIKEFWLGLGEVERRNLVKIEKDMVLKKMKEQQKHSCSCAVCGRKRFVLSIAKSHEKIFFADFCPISLYFLFLGVSFGSILCFLFVGHGGESMRK